MGTKRSRGFLLLALPLAFAASASSVAASPPTERIVEREHKTEYVQVVTDDVCGDVAGSQGLRSGTFHNVETGHRYITWFEDRLHVVDVENGTYAYDFDDPAIPDVSGYRYTSPTSIVINKNDNVTVTQNQHEFLPGHPDGITIQFRMHFTWQDGEPIVEREFFNVTGCP
jgi:hypothetical protein